MRKTTILCAALLIAVMLPWIATAEESTECYAFAYYQPDLAAYHDVSDTEAARLIAVDTGWRMYALVLPEGSATSPEDYHYAGLRLVFDEPFPIQQDGNRLYEVALPEDGVLRPRAVEIVGAVSYGQIQSITDEALVMTIWYDSGSTGDEPNYDGPTATYAITSETLICHLGDELAPGFGCTALVNDDGEALLLAGGNG